MKTNSSSRLRNVENDPRLLFWFAIFLMLLMLVWSFLTNSDLFKPVTFASFLGLFAVHIFLHWKFSWAYEHPRWLVAYTVFQGLLAFGITLISRNIGMVFCLFMALIGELLSVYRITMGGILATVYLLALAFTNFILLLGLKQAGWFALGTIPTIIFVGIYVILFTRQAEARQQAQSLLKDLEAANRQLSEYAAQVEDLTLAGERQRMARELHDTLSQGLAGLILQLEAVDAHLSGNRIERARSILEQTMERARLTLSEARRAIDNLRQPDERDLAEAIREESERFSSATGIPCQVEISLPDKGLSESVNEACLRAVSEGLTNIARHAQAENAELRIVSNKNQDELLIQINDNGVGFDPAAVEAGHYGLLGMRERVRLAGGSLEVHSAPGQGASLMIRFPLESVVHA